MKYRVYTYDVWGNKKDGFEINDCFATDIMIDSSKDIVKSLKQEGFIKKSIKNKSFEIEGDEDCLYITYAPDYYPLCELRRIDSWFTHFGLEI